MSAHEAQELRSAWRKMDKIDWDSEKNRFMELAYTRCEQAARSAFKRWPEWKREDAIAEAGAKMWYQWRCCLEKGKEPSEMIGPLIRWAILHVRYDRKIAGRAPSYDVMDYRAKMGRHDLDGQGRAHPTNRSDPANNWIDWTVKSRTSDPGDMVAALDGAGLSTKEWSR